MTGALGRALLWPAIPLALGAVGTIIAVAAGDRRELVWSSAIAWMWLELGALVAVIALAVVLARRAAARGRERAREAGAAAERAEHRRFVARLDHEVKNPVTAIRAELSNLPGDAAAARVDAQAVRLSRLLADVRKLGELESAPLEREPVDVERLARDAVDAVSELPEAAHRALAVGFPRAPRRVPPIEGDADLLFLAVYNLLANAVKYSEPGADIEVRGSEDDGVVTIEVADTGLGIPEDEQAAVWEELARGSRTRAIPGSGLGLPLVRTIVQRHGGSAELSSRAGEGTVVRLRLPVRGG
jgi:two-component system, OmpR family, sensor kinase